MKYFNDTISRVMDDFRAHSSWPVRVCMFINRTSPGEATLSRSYMSTSHVWAPSNSAISDGSTPECTESVSHTYKTNIDMYVYQDTLSTTPNDSMLLVVFTASKVSRRPGRWIGWDMRMFPIRYNLEHRRKYVNIPKQFVQTVGRIPILSANRKIWATLFSALYYKIRQSFLLAVFKSFRVPILPYIIRCLVYSRTHRFFKHQAKVRLFGHNRFLGLRSYGCKLGNGSPCSPFAVPILNAASPEVRIQRRQIIMEYESKMQWQQFVLAQGSRQ